jgi:hypothetical protein
MSLFFSEINTHSLTAMGLFWGYPYRIGKQSIYHELYQYKRQTIKKVIIVPNKIINVFVK